MARTGIRASAIIIKDNKILLIHRRKEGKEYWVFPGGGIEEGETGEETIAREVKEETELRCEKVKLAFKDYNFGNEHPFYFVEVEDGEPKLSGPEVERQSDDNWYYPEWVKIETARKLENLYPNSARDKLFDLIKNNR